MFELVSGCASAQKMSETGNDIHASMGLIDVPRIYDVYAHFAQVWQRRQFHAYFRVFSARWLQVPEVVI